jgi:nucleoside-diphosphate-sugar epimerase
MPSAQNVPTHPILITGITGYIGSHIALQLLELGYQVRGSVRSLTKAEALKTTLSKLVDTSRLSFVEADLLNPESWRAAMDGCRKVMHVASPFFASEPKHPDDLILPARQGTLNVLEAATNAGVERVVLTSSMAAVTYGLDHSPQQPIAEDRWTDPNHRDTSTYIRSKTLAERAAWDFVEANANAPELVAINPGVVVGPLLSEHCSDSHLVVAKMLRGELPGLPRFGFEFVDVRDVANLHLRALEAAQAAGNRYLAVAGFRSLSEVRDVLAKALPDFRKRLPRWELPDWAIRVFSLIDAETRGVINELGKVRVATSAKATSELSWQPRSVDESIATTARDLLKFDRI